jgi:predicted dithiol-disulfide oxidoreductase (DUF899 family)
MDNFNGITVHPEHRDITFVAVSYAPYKKLADYKKRMGWSFPWYASWAAISTSTITCRSGQTS